MKNLPKIAQILPTRRCNGGCDGCLLSKDTCRERSLRYWQNSFLDLDKGGVKGVKILGGEPTLLEWLPDLIAFAKEKTDLKVAVLSNCRFSETMKGRLIDACLGAFSASYDFITPEAKDRGMQEKAKLAMKTLMDFKEAGVLVLGVNVVIAPHNIAHIPTIVKEMHEKGIWVNVCPIIYGPGNFVIRTTMTEGMLTSGHRESLKDLGDYLIDLKRKGCRITNSEAYLQGLPTFGISLNWKCRKMDMLQLDFDGKIMTCPDREGQKSFYPADLFKPESQRQFLAEWRADVSSCNPGCYWSATYDATFGLPEYWR